MNNNNQEKEGTTLNINANGIFLLGIVFVVLKLCGVIAWSWIWVTAPFWGPLLIGVSAFVLFWIYHSFKGRK